MLVMIFALSCPFLHGPALSYPASPPPHYPVLPGTILSCPALSYPALHYPVLPCLVLSCSALSYSIPPGPILAQSCPALLSRTLPVLSFVPFHIQSLPVLAVLSCPALPCLTIETRIQYSLCK
jgi:hypothetical protein